MLIVAVIVAIILPIYIGWRVWRHLDVGVDPDDIEGSETVRGLVNKVLASAGVTFVLMLFFFGLIDLF